MFKTIFTLSLFLAGCAGTSLNYIPDKGFNLNEARKSLKAFYLERKLADYVVITEKALLLGKGQPVTPETADDTAAVIRGRRLFFNDLQKFKFYSTGRRYQVFLWDMNDKPVGKYRFDSEGEASQFLDALWKLKRNAKDPLEGLDLENIQ